MHIFCPSAFHFMPRTVDRFRLLIISSYQEPARNSHCILLQIKKQSNFTFHILLLRFNKLQSPILFQQRLKILIKSKVERSSEGPSDKLHSYYLRTLSDNLSKLNKHSFYFALIRNLFLIFLNSSVDVNNFWNTALWWTDGVSLTFVEHPHYYQSVLITGC